MTATHSSGPAIVYGQPTASGGSNPDVGPCATYQGDSLIDPRYQYAPGATGTGQVRGFFNYAYLCLLDAIPKAPSATLLVAVTVTPTVPGGGTFALTLASTVASGRAVNVPLVPYGAATTAVVTPGIMIEPGHTTGTSTAGSTTIASVADPRMIPVGSYIAVVAGASGGVNPSIHQVTAKTFSTLTVTPAVPASAAATPILIMDKAGLGASAHVQTGPVAVMDPYGSCARGISVTTTANDVAYSVLVSGYDTFGAAMSESITCGNATTVNGLKAFKFVSSVTLVKSGGGTMAGNISVGVSDKIGLNVRAEFWEYMNVFFNGAFISSSTGWVAGLASGTASTTTTADVRGTYAPATTDGSKRLALFMSVPARQAIGASYADPSAIDGQAQA